MCHERIPWSSRAPLRVACFALLAAACATAATKPTATPEKPTPTEPYVISVSRPEGGVLKSADLQIDCGSGGGMHEACSPVRYSSSVVLTAVAEPGWKFVGWAADCSGTAPTCRLDTSKTKADKWVVAVFEPASMYRGTYFRVTVVRPQGGTITSDDKQLRCGTHWHHELCGPALYPWEGEATLRATPDDGYTFEGWTGDCSGKGRCTLTTKPLTADKTVSARFAPR